MGTPGQSTRWLLISLLLFVTIFAAVLWSAAGDPALVVAARDGDFGAVRTLLAKRVNVNEPARDGSTALLWAVYNSDLADGARAHRGRRELQYAQPLRRHAAAAGQPHGRYAHDCGVAEGGRGRQEVRSSGGRDAR